MTSDLPRFVTVQWPAAPLIDEWTGSQLAVAWIRYKIKTADWYIDTLRQLGDTLPDYDRYAGVEMAIEGALGALSSAFDAAAGTLHEKAEMRLNRKVKGSKNQPWDDCIEALSLLEASGVDVGTLGDDLAAAFGGQSAPDPKGWLASLRRLRNGPLHRATMGRQFTITVTEPATVVARDEEVLIHIPGADAQHPLDYLTNARAQVSALAERMITVIITVAPEQG